ncbi:MAG: hypothetical protein ACPGSM_20110 [Thiolinea sp.]
MPTHLCFAQSFETRNQPLTLKMAVKSAASKKRPALSWKERIILSFTNWATKRMKQAVYNGWE